MKKLEKRILYAGGIMLLLFLGFVFTAVISVVVTDQKIKKIQTLYNQGFDLVLKKIPIKQESIKDKGIKVLSLVKFYRSKIRWTQIINGMAYIPQKNPKDKLPYLAVLPPHSETLIARQRNLLVLKTDLEKNIFILTIKPTNISSEWAGLTLVHGITHLLELRKWDKDRIPTEDEFLQIDTHAFQIQILAAEKFSGGAYNKAIADLAVKYKLDSPETALDKLRDDYGLQEEVSVKLDRTIFSDEKTEPLSRDERIERDDFYIISICFYLIEKDKAKPEEKEEEYISVLKKFYDLEETISQVQENKKTKI